MNAIVYIDNIPKFNLQLSQTTTIGNIRSVLNNYLITQGKLPNQYQIKMYINKSTEIPVFNNYEYDNVNMSSVWSQLNTPMIVLTNIIHNLEKLPKDIVRKISLDLSPSDVVSLCQTNKFFQNSVCNSDDFWRNKIRIDYPMQKYSNDYYQNSPKNLYMLLSMNSKIVTLDRDDYPELVSHDYNDDEMMANFITRSIINKPPREFLKRGDVLYIDWVPTYRNDGKFMWDGEKVVPLDFSQDDYGGIPEEFSFPEFRPGYFSDSIVHNNIIRFDETKQKEIVENFDPVTQKSYVTDRYNKYEIVLANAVDYVSVKFSEIFVDNNSYFEVEDDNIYYFVPTYNQGGGGYMRDGCRHFYTGAEFPSKWKDAIISIEPDDSNTVYEWIGNKLSVKGKEILFCY